MTTRPRPTGADHWMHRMPDRIRRGPDAPGAKLNAFEIAELCAAYDSGATNKSQLARLYGVSRITIWRHLKARDL
jgi:transcriptional regulator of acetoin/glycerol metabolism